MTSAGTRKARWPVAPQVFSPFKDRSDVSLLVTGILPGTHDFSNMMESFKYYTCEPLKHNLPAVLSFPFILNILFFLLH